MGAALPLALLAAVVAVGLRWGSFVAGGSDSYCYLHQAERWASGRLQVPEPLALEAPWPDAPLTFAPAGHVPSAPVPGAIVPICPPGLSMAMAPLLALGGVRAAAWLVPLFGAVLVAAVHVIASRFSRRIALPSAVVAAASPIFLYQVVQPMSDVPAAALWLVSVAFVTGTGRRDPALAGLAASAAILVRPNLVPFAAPLLLFLLFRPERSWRVRAQAAAMFAGCVLPGVLAVAAIQNNFYGSPLSSGYGNLDRLFSTSNVAPNGVRYATWLSQTHTPAWVLAAAAPLLLPGALTRLLVSLFLVNVALYLPYVVFEDWSYLRFLLPTIPLVLILFMACVHSLCRRWVPWTARPVLTLMALMLAMVYVQQAEARSAFRLHVLETRYEAAGRFAREHLPPNAIVITSSQSGSVRFYAGRKTLVWDSLDPAWLERAIAYLQTRGFQPVLLLETGEESQFRQRFASSATGRLDWPPAADIGSRLRLYRPGDRQTYLSGTRVPTTFVPF